MENKSRVYVIFCPGIGLKRVRLTDEGVKFFEFLEAQGYLEEDTQMELETGDDRIYDMTI